LARSEFATSVVEAALVDRLRIIVHPILLGGDRTLLARSSRAHAAPPDVLERLPDVVLCHPLRSLAGAGREDVFGLGMGASG
jgi:hypothetical protein